MNHIKEHLNKNFLIRLFIFNRHIKLIARSVLITQSLTILNLDKFVLNGAWG